MKICVFGVARSGTTSLYSLLQEIMLDVYEKVDFVYEPFLWDTDVFNDRYANVRHKFALIDSISPKGIQAHLELPLFLTNPETLPASHFLNSIFDSKDPLENLLVKFIRANGRYFLINKACPDCKSIIVVRNPADTINSIIHNFSFYGGDFHKDDFPRFVEEVSSVFNEVVETKKDYFSKEAEYWYYMTKSILESSKKSQSSAMIICHEEYLRNREEHIKRICSFLGVDHELKYLEWNKMGQGEITREFKITLDQREILAHYLELYFDLLKNNNIPYSFSQEEILNKYEIIKEEPELQRNRLYGITPLILKNQIGKIKSDFDIERNNSFQYQEKLMVKERENSELVSQVNQYQEKLMVKERENSELVSQVNQYQEKLMVKEKENSELASQVNVYKNEIEVVKSSLESLHNQQEILKEELVRNENKVDVLRNERKFLNNELLLLENKVREIVVEIEDKNNRLQQLYKRNSALLFNLESIHNSTSWKVLQFFLRPLIYIKDGFVRLSRRDK